MACPSPFDVLRLRQEDLGPRLYSRATVLDPWLNLIPRDVWPIGAGLLRSSFEIGRSEPASVEETWATIVVQGVGGVGSCAKSFTDTYVGELERTYAPEQFWLRGPVICQSELTLHWNSADFWTKYFMRLEQRNTRSIVNRLQNIYGSYVPKVWADANGAVQYAAGVTATQPPGAALDMTGVSIPACGLTQDLLDSQVSSLILSGATAEDTDGWITNMGSGPTFPLLIGVDASNQIALNNPELREDIRQAFMGAGEGAMVLQRLGATRVIKNYRHTITATPPRWSIVGQNLARVSPWTMSTNAADATKGQVAIPNPNYLDPYTAQVEGAFLLNPMVFTEEILQPVNNVAGTNFPVQNYYGEWSFVTGNDAFLGMDSCAGVADPLHEMGRHFAVYKHAAKPIFPDWGRLFLFLRCPQQVDCLSCS